MARYEGGWIKLHRKVLRNEVIDDAPALAIWTLLLLWANRKDGVSRLKRQLQSLQRGQVATSPREIARKLKLDKGVVNRRLADLEDAHMLTRETTQSGTIITIVNFAAYQRKDTKASQSESHRRVTDESQTSHRRTHSGEDKNSPTERRIEKKGPPNRARERAHARNDRATEGETSKLELRAQGILNKAIGAIRKQLPDDEAVAYVGEAGWAALQVRYPTWTAFKHAYAKAYEEATPTIVEGQLRMAIMAELAAELH